MPICFVSLGSTVYSPIDDKAKASDDPTRLRRVRNLLVDPRATILIDRWDEDWANLAWLELRCDGSLAAPGDPDHPPAVAALRAKYPQYATHDLERRPMLRFTPTRAASWGDPD